MYFDIHILFNSNKVPYAIDVRMPLFQYLYTLTPARDKTTPLNPPLDNPLKLGRQKERLNPYGISLPSTFWRVNHTINFYQGLIDLLQKNKFSVKEIFMSLEDTSTFLIEDPLRISPKKILDPFGNNKSYFYHMPEEELKSQNIFKIRLIFCYFFPDSEIGKHTYAFAQPDKYIVSKVEGGYFVEEKTINFFIGCIGYFRYIKQKDIDSRVITEIERTGEYVVKKDGDWWFIYKKGIDDLKT